MLKSRLLVGRDAFVCLSVAINAIGSAITPLPRGLLLGSPNPRRSVASTPIHPQLRVSHHLYLLRARAPGHVTPSSHLLRLARAWLPLSHRDHGASSFGLVHPYCTYVLPLPNSHSFSPLLWSSFRPHIALAGAVGILDSTQLFSCASMTPVFSLLIGCAYRHRQLCDQLDVPMRPHA
jgi:hypothetical protein